MINSFNLEMVKTNKALKSLENSILNDIISKIESLDVNSKDDIVKELKKSPPKRKAPKIPEEKRCTSLTLKGEKCEAPKCSNGKCWPHMTKQEKDKYTASKKKK